MVRKILPLHIIVIDVAIITQNVKICVNNKTRKGNIISREGDVVIIKTRDSCNNKDIIILRNDRNMLKLTLKMNIFRCNFL